MTRKHPLAKCEECPLQHEPYVPSYGPDDPQVVVIGEAPGAQEASIGRPFVGSSGRLLRKVLAHYDISDERIYFTNVCLCRPPGNKNPTAKAIAACSDRLNTELGQFKPDFFLAVGGISGKAILKSRQGITKLRVRGATVVEGLQAPVIATFHPAAALRKPDHLPSIFKDVERAVNRKVSVQWEPTKYKVIDNPDESIRALTELMNYEEMAIDVEVCSPDGESHGRPQEFRWLCIGVSHEPGKAVVFTPNAIRDSRAKRVWTDLLLRRKGIYHNGKFDIQFLRGYFGWDDRIKVDDDTMLMHYMCDERVGTHDLEQVAVDYLNAPMYKTEAKGELAEDERSLAYLPPDTLYRYNATDVDVTHRLAHVLRKTMRDEQVENPYHNLLIPANNVIADMEFHGIYLDTNRLDALEDEFSHILTKMKKKFDEQGINPNSHIQLGKALAELGFDVPNVQKATIETIDHPFVEEVLAYKKRHKAQSTYLTSLHKKKYIYNHRIYPSYKLHGTETGRLSSAKPNIQNQPNEFGIRNIFIATPGKNLVQADYSGIELRLAGIFAKDPYLCQAFKDGRSPHREGAEAFFGSGYSKQQYTTMKSINFGTLYRESANHLAARLKITPHAAQKMIDAFFARSPVILDYHKELQRQVKENGYLTSYFGRKRHFWLITNENWWDISKEAFNFPLQSAASDITLQSFIKLHEQLKGVARPLITVHDSIAFECDPVDVPDVVRTMKATMEQEIEGVPLTVEFAVGEAWGSLKEYVV